MFKSSLTRRFLQGSSVVAILMPMQIAIAQTASDTPNEARSDAAAYGAHDIVVTAQKKVQRLLDVPVPVSAVSSDTLTTQAIVKLSEYFDRVPGLQYGGGRTSGLSLRGITTGGGATNPTVALLVDDVQFGGSTNAGQPPSPDFDPATLERVEVLRGPQGTLYGASSLGGLIKYVMKAPDTKSTFGRAEIGANTVDGGNVGYSGRATLNLPILEDRVALLVSGFYRQDPRWIDNVRAGYVADNVNKKEVLGGRAALLLKPTDRLTLTVSGLYQKQNTNNSDLSITTGGIRVCPECQGTGNTAPTNYKPFFADLSTISVIPSVGVAEYQLYSAKADWELGSATLTSISAWGRSDNAISSDVTVVFGGLLIPLYSAPSTTTVGISDDNHTRKFSQEVRLAGSLSGVDYLLGGFYTVEHSTTDQVLTFTSGTTGQPYAASGPSRYREYAAFGDLTFHLSDKFDVQVGGRYAKNSQRNTRVLATEARAVPAYGPSATVVANSDEGAFTWLVSPSYHFSRDVMLYARLASGYRPGGPNLSRASIPTYGSDKVTNYEIGFKGYVVPDMLSLDVSAFQIDWKNIQLQNTDAVSQLTFLSNGGTARSRGVELQAQLRPTSSLTVDLNGTFTDAVLTQDLPIAAGATSMRGRKGERLPFSARFTTTLSVQQNFDLSTDLSGFLGFTLTHLGERLGAFRNSAASATRPRIVMPAYTQVYLNAGLTFRENWHLNVYARNLFNDRGVIVADNRNGTNTPSALFTQPRTVGVTLAREF